MAFDYEKLPKEFKREYVPVGIRFDWDDISKVFDELSSRVIAGPSGLERWILDWSEFDAYLYEQRAIRYINSTRQTDNPEFTKAYEDYVEGIEPKIKVASFGLLKKYVASQFREALPPSHAADDRRREAAVRTFRVENVELEKQDSALSQKYQRTMGGMTVEYRGQERTLQQMAKFLEETDRGVREEAWRLANGRAARDRGVLDDLYTRMVELRDDVAKNAGYDNFEDYTFVKKCRFDYTPADCVSFHEAVEEHIVPLSREIDRVREEKMGVGTLRPWDLNVDPDGLAPLSPFTDIDGLVAGAKKVVAGVDAELSGYFDTMARLELLDLDSRKGKAPGGYQDEFAEKRLPFIFMNAAKRDGDVRTLLHEAGHSFHTFLMRKGGLPFFNAGESLPLEFAEVASMSMEVISGEHYRGVFYDEEEARRSNWWEAAGNIKLFAWVATIDSFQHWVYNHPRHSPEERTAAWLATLDRFCGRESYEGIEEARECRWQRQLHLYEAPFYYIEYGIALTGALGVWARYRKDRRDAIEAYKRALSLGASKPLPELFEAAGVEWGFGARAVSRCADELRSAIREYG
ncbi:MAG: M3 family oligoendopeptidase [Nitrososphaerota archaeon]|nr:M3 family oligoendopeptidase [Nitrososphaerota archaeon]